jgi:hypothetical protein
MDAQARTMERILATANTQMRLMAEYNEKLTTANTDLLDYIRAQKESEALAAQQSQQVTNELSKALVDNLPMLMGMFEKLAGPKLGKVAKVMNGAASVAAVASGNNPQQ